MYTACQFSSLGVRCGNCTKCNLAAAIAERDAYRAALEALVGARQHCTNCDAIAVLESCDWSGDHVYGCDACGGLPEMSDAKQARAAIALLAADKRA